MRELSGFFLSAHDRLREIADEGKALLKDRLPLRKESRAAWSAPNAPRPLPRSLEQTYAGGLRSGPRGLQRCSGRLECLACRRLHDPEGSGDGADVRVTHEQPCTQLAPAWRSGGRTHLVTLRGMIDVDIAREFELRVRDLAMTGKRTIVVDLTALDELTPSLLGALIRAQRSLSWRNGGTPLVCDSSVRAGNLAFVGLPHLFDLVDVGELARLRSSLAESRSAGEGAGEA